MTFPTYPSPNPNAYFRNGLHPGAGALTSHRKHGNGKGSTESGAAAEAWVNEGGSIGPAADRRDANTRKSR